MIPRQEDNLDTCNIKTGPYVFIFKQSPSSAAMAIIDPQLGLIMVIWIRCTFGNHTLADIWIALVPRRQSVLMPRLLYYDNEGIMFEFFQRSTYNIFIGTY